LAESLRDQAGQVDFPPVQQTLRLDLMLGSASETA
jgi:hypothetical protein